MQNLIYFEEICEQKENISRNACVLYLNRFLIDEDDACELSGVYQLEKWPQKLPSKDQNMQIKPKSKHFEATEKRERFNHNILVNSSITI